MTKEKFISVSKRMVTEYYNRYVTKNNPNGEKASMNNISVIGFYNKSGNYRLLLSTPTSDGLYYEVTYDKNTDEINSYAYKKVGKNNNGKNERNQNVRDIRNSRYRR